jgi:mannose-6-phosphate isomerase-like protein (cupin superfamily)
MIVKNIFTSATEKKRVHEGEGLIEVSRPFIRSDFKAPWNFVDYAVLPPGTSIGLHTHGNNEELYCILEGEGVMTVNGEECRVSKGDLILNPPGGTHGLENQSTKALSILVIEVKIPG